VKAATVVGNPRVGIPRSTACLISTGEAPASSAFLSGRKKVSLLAMTTASLRVSLTPVVRSNVMMPATNPGATIRSPAK
jgi:hypothetical protein